MIVRELVALLGFDVDESGVKRAEKVYRDLKGRAEAVVAATVAIGAAFTGALLGAVRLAKGASDGLIELENAARSVGTSAESLRELRYAAEVAGVGIEALQGGLTHLAKNAAEAARGQKEPAIAFAQLGVRATDARGQIKPVDDLLGDIAERFDSMPDGAKKTALALRVLGEGGSRLIPILTGGRAALEALRSESRDQGVVDGRAIEQAREFRGEWAKLGVTWDRLAGGIGTDLLPAVSGLIRGARGLLLEVRPLIRSEVGGWFRDFASGATFAIGPLRRLLEAGVNVGSIFGGLRGAALALSAVLIGGLSWALGRLVVMFGEAGNAAILMQLKALAIGAAIVALGVLFWLIWDDVTVGLRGGKSLIKEIQDALLAPVKPEDSWLVQIAKAAAKALDWVGAWVVKLETSLRRVYKLASGELTLQDISDLNRAEGRTLGNMSLVEREQYESGNMTKRGSGLIRVDRGSAGVALVQGNAPFRSFAYAQTPPSIALHVEVHGKADPAEIAKASESGVRAGYDAILQRHFRDAEAAGRSPVVR